MSINPETDLDLEKLFLPAWAQEIPSATRYAKYTGNEGAPRERGGDDRRGPRPPRRDGGPARRNDAPGGPRRDDGFRGPPRGQDRGPRRDDRRDSQGGERRSPMPSFPEVSATLIPDVNGVNSLARQIKITGRAFPLFDIARLIIEKPERYSMRFAVRKKAEGQIAQPLFLCALDDTLWLSEDEAVAHVLSRHFGTFYQAERTATEPPKGVYTFVAQCGTSGVILGPPNHHDYQNQLRKLHAERFSRMPFDFYKSGIKIVRDEAVVKQWIEEQSWRTEYTCLNVPEPLRLPNRAEVETHFRATHKDTIIKSVESHDVRGVACRALRGGLGLIVQDLLAEQRRFPMQIASALSQAFVHHGLQLYKVNKNFTHVAVARPNFLDLETTPVSDGVKRIVDFINATAKCNRRKLVDALVPSPPPAPIPVAPATIAEAAAAAPTPPEPTPEQTAMISDLHWLVHQGHVIEFANGTIETAKKPQPRPPKPEKKAAPAPTATATPAAPEADAAEATTAAEPESSPEAPTSEAEVGSAPAASTDEAPAPEEPATDTPEPFTEPK